MVVVVSMGEVSLVAVSTGEASVAAVLMAATSMAIFDISDSLMMSSSAASAFQGGGAGAIHTDITVTAITRTLTMDTAGIHTATTVAGATVITVALVMDIAMEAERVMDMAMAAEPVTDTAMAANHGIPGAWGVGDKIGYDSLKSPAY